MQALVVQEHVNVPAPYVPAPSHGLPSAQEIAVYEVWAKYAVDSQMYRSMGKEAGVMMILLAAREYGIPPAMALNGGLKLINGNVEMSARIMESLIRRAGHKIKIGVLDPEKCTVYGYRKDNGDTQWASFTIEEAKQAGLVKEGGGWKKFPMDMLYARALSRLARRLFADVIGVGYVQGEISGETPEMTEHADEVQPVTPPPNIEDLMAHFAEKDQEIGRAHV